MTFSRHKAWAAGVATALVTVLLRLLSPHLPGIEMPTDAEFERAVADVIQYLIEGVLAGGLVALGVERTPNKLLSQPDKGDAQ